jgi:hypothetical protein
VVELVENSVLDDDDAQNLLFPRPFDVETAGKSVGTPREVSVKPSVVVRTVPPEFIYTKQLPTGLHIALTNVAPTPPVGVLEVHEVPFVEVQIAFAVLVLGPATIARVPAVSDATTCIATVVLNAVAVVPMTY